MVVEGHVWKLGNNVDTDQLVPGRYLSLTDPQELASHCLEDVLPEFSTSVKPGDIVMAGENFGCGSSREHAPIALKALGISFVVASSFARIFFRNCINVGLPALTSPEAVEAVENSDKIRIDLEAGRVEDLSRAFQCSVAPLPDFVAEVMTVGGMTAYVHERMQSRKAIVVRKRSRNDRFA